MYSCTNESIIQTTENYRLFGHLENVSRTTFVSNDNITYTHWVEGDSIGVFASAQQNILFNALNSGKSTEFKTKETGLIFKDNDKIAAYYPYTDSVKGNSIKLPVTTEMSSTDSSISFMYGNSISCENEFNLHFNHLYAYLQIKLSTQFFNDRVSSLPENYIKKEGIYFEINSTEYISTSNAWFNLETNNISYSEKDVSKTIRYYCDDIDFTKTDTLTYMIPILPQVDGTKIRIYIVYPASKEGYILPIGFLNDKEVPVGGFKAGHVYTINTVDDFKPSTKQYKLLEDFFNSTNGHLWRNNKNWLSDKPLKEWFGLNEDYVNNTYVNKIKLNRNLLTGTLPDSFVDLMDCAQYIDLSFNGMSGKIPDVIKQHNRWEEIGWNIVSQDTRLSDGFDLSESDLYISNFNVINILDSCDIDIKDFFAKYKLTQIIWHCPNKIEDMKDFITESHINLHLGYKEKGFGTILLSELGTDIKSQSEFINKTYGNIKELYWCKAVTYPNNSMYYGMSYTFNSEGELVYFAPYYYEPYIWLDDYKGNDIVLQKYNLYLKSVLGEPDKIEKFKFTE